MPSEAMYRLINRLMLEAPTLEGEHYQEPAIICHVLLRMQPQPIYGSLSRTSEGTLRMMTPTSVQHAGERVPRQVMLEQFFSYEDVVCVMMEREIKVESSRIIT